jgi:hypothetical protein
MLLPVGEEQAGGNIASRRVCLADFRFPISGSLGVEPSPSPRSETEAALGLSQRRALILVLVLSFALCAGIWVTVALLSAAGGDDLG